MLIGKPDDAARGALLDRAEAFDAALAATTEAARTEDRGEDRAEDAPPAASPADIWRAAATGDPASLRRVLEAGRARPAVAAAFARALDRSAQAVFRPLRAAADGAVSRRLDGGCSVELRRSAQRPGRCFVVVRLPAGAPAPSELLWRRGETTEGAAGAGALGALALGPLVDGVSQVAVDAADPAVAAIEDRAATLYLR
ncbi:MAG: hypothetical protein ACFCUS_05660 [Rubrimonas sp.]|uniref:hypothetical protein n=1 Tax=Rubrimonas sp. TaxID=2036015 RepID=UPI002FDD47F6